MRQAAAIAVIAALALAGCSATEPPQLQPSTGMSEPTPSASASDAPASADVELDAFRAAIDGHSPADPAALVAAIEAAGFDRSTIERTRELDSLGAPVTFLEVAVRLGDSCLIGQVGDGEPLVMRAAPVGGGRCLVGGVVTVD